MGPSFESVLARSNNIFELTTVEPIDVLMQMANDQTNGENGKEEAEEMGDLQAEEKDNCLHLKGQVKNVNIVF